MQHPNPHTAHRRATPPPRFEIKHYFPEAQPMDRCPTCDELTEAGELAASQVGNCFACDHRGAK